MDKIFSEILGNSGNVQFSPVLIVPVVIVVIAAVAVFFFGFKKPIEPKFKKFVSVDVNQKKTKRKDATVNGSNTTAAAVSSTSTKLKSVQNGSTMKAPRNATTPLPLQIDDETVKLSPIPIAKSKKSISPQQSANNKSIANKKSTTTPQSLSSSNKKVVVAKKEKPQKKEKPVDFDDGEWQTVTSRTDKKKKIEENSVLSTVNNNNNSLSSAISAAIDNKRSLNEKSQQQKSTTVKNQKQLKDQVNKSKKAAIDANKQKKPIAEDVTVVPVSFLNVIEADKPRKIEDVIAELATEKPKPIEEVIAELAAAKWEQSNSKNEEIVKKQLTPIDANKNISVGKGAVVNPPSELVQTVDSINNVFDEAEDSWTEAKTPKKSKRRVRKD